jgi:cytochrome b involved in lipid metabolism
MDLIVVGGGISGLYTIYKLLQTNKRDIKQILLLESTSRLGGRIHTINKKSQIYEAGGARFSNHHMKLMELIKEFNMEKKLIPLNSSKVYISSENPSVQIPITNQSDKALAQLTSMIRKEKISEEELLSKTFYEVANKISPELTQEFLKYYPYYSEVYVMNARDALISLNRDFTNKTQYYILAGGLEQIIKKIVDFIKKQNVNVKIKLNSRLTNILEKSSGEGFIIEYEHKNKKINVETSKLVLALTSNSLLSIPFIKKQEFNHLLRLVSSQPLFRIYAKYTKAWIPNHIITNTELNYIIPYSMDGLIMISYTDGPETEIWYKYYLESEDKLIEMLHKKLNEIMPDVTIPKLEWIDACPHWKDGSHYWLPRKEFIDSNDLENKIRHPINNLWIVGEAYSNYQAWVEGALDTSMKAINEINNINMEPITKSIKLTKISKISSSPKKTIKSANSNSKSKTFYTMEEVAKHNKKSDAWLVINNMVYDVTNWIPDHPGGMIIMKGVGMDATELFKKVGHDSYAKNKLKTFKIGKLKL